MSKKRKRPDTRPAADKNPQPSQRPAPKPEFSVPTRGATMTMTAMRLAMDSFTNSMARLGEGQDNLLAGNDYFMTRRTQNVQLMNALYRNDWIARRIVDTFAEDMCKNWYRISSQVEPDMLDVFARLERRMNLKQKLITGLKWGRLYGGALGVIIIDGQDDMLSEPLNPELIMPGDFKGINILDRWNGVSPSTQLVEDLSDPDFGLPEYYNASFNAVRTGGYTIHHSRIVRFIGRELPYIEQVAEMYWGMSELEHVYDELTKRNMTSANIAQLIFQANLRIMKMEDFGEMLASTSPDMQKDLYNTISAQNMLMNSHGIQVMSKDDDFQTYSYAFGGLSDIYEQFMLDISGACEIPATKLFGRAPAGLNSTGEGDMKNYYDAVLQKQEAQLRPVLDKLVPVLCMSAWGQVPDDIEYEFNPVREASDDERASIIQRTGQVINASYQIGLIGRKTALKELRAQESATGMFGNSITDEDIDNADNDTGLPPYEAMAPTGGGLLAEQGSGVGVEPLSDESEANPPNASLNGIQISSLLAIVQSVAAGTLPRDSAIEMIVSAFPFDREQAENILGKAGLDSGMPPENAT